MELLLTVLLGGGTDIHGALGYAQGLVRAPHDTIPMLVSAVYGVGDRHGMLERTAALVGAGVQVIAPLARSDAGAPSCDARTAGAFAALGIGASPARRMPSPS